MNLRLFRRRTVWWPTWLGWITFAVLAGGAGVSWWFKGESFLATTQRLQPDVLVVDGWIGYDGVRAAGTEFKQSGYRYIVTTGGPTNERWRSNRDSYANLSQYELLKAGLPPEVIVVAPSKDTQVQRTYESAVAVWRALHERGIRPETLNVFTLGAHARRSRLVYEKVFKSQLRVGVISWQPDDLNFAGEPWWQSSERATDFLKESFGYFLEALLNSGRISNSPEKLPPQPPTHVPNR